jgi:predicted dehydrogenase
MIMVRNGRAAANERIRMAAIGVGGQGHYNMSAFIQDPRVEMVAVCDVDAGHRERARNDAKLPPEKAYNDFRELLAKEALDAVCIGTPDHWHALIVIAAARKGLDIFCEKPLSYSIDEGKAMVQAVRKYGRVLQTGTWRRSRAMCRRACELVRNGYIGELKEARACVPKGYNIQGGDRPEIHQPAPVPEGFDYDLWLGPAPMAPYTPGRCHFNFRWIQDYAEGYISDWGAHYLDVAAWGAGVDRTGPVSAEGWGKFPSSGLYDAAIEHRVEFKYANGAKLVSLTSDKPAEWGIHFEGTEGYINVESEKLETRPGSIASIALPTDAIHLYNSPNHHANFIDCVYSRGETAAPVDVGHRCATICHLANIVALLGRGVKWDPEKEQFQDDAEATRYMTRPMRGAWTLDV